jgi:hypothetical protein
MYARDPPLPTLVVRANPLVWPLVLTPHSAQLVSGQPQANLALGIVAQKYAQPARSAGWLLALYFRRPVVRFCIRNFPACCIWLSNDLRGLDHMIVILLADSCTWDDPLISSPAFRGGRYCALEGGPCTWYAVGRDTAGV